MSQQKSVFVSYSWDDERHKSWTRALAERLMANGVRAYLDQWDVVYGQSLTHFMDEKLQAADFVIAICTPAYAAKSTARAGGVGYEAQIITARIAAQVPRSKLVPIVRVGSLSPLEPDCALPPHFQGVLSLDMRNDASFDLAFEDLIRHVYDQPSVQRPGIGPPPTFLQNAPERGRRLASFEVERWHLASGTVRTEKYPETFQIPDEVSRRGLRQGDVVKLMFEYMYEEPEEDDPSGERMWVIVTGMDGPYFTGRLRNHPICAKDEHDLFFDTEVVFLPEHVIEVERN